MSNQQQSSTGSDVPTCSASWLPIETAPRDGTDIIVGFDSASVWIVHVAWWRELEDWMRDDPEWSEEDVGWWSYTNHSVTQEKLEGHRTPTHWIPLPSLPNVKVVAPPPVESDGFEIEKLKGGCPPTPCSPSFSTMRQKTRGR